MEETWQGLRIGDRIRLVSMPLEWDRPDYRVPPCTRRLMRRLIARKRALRICEVDDWGAPWVHCRIRRPDNRWAHHWLTITQGGWVRVRHRKYVQPVAAADRRTALHRPWTGRSMTAWTPSP